jgi:hypothetical protein
MSRTLEFQKFCRSEFEHEAASGFLRLRRVPSTYVCQFLSYYSELTSQEKEAHVEAATLWAAVRLGGDADIPAYESLQQNEVWKRWVNWSTMNGWRFPSIPHLRDRERQAKIDAAHGIPSEVSQEIKTLTASARAVNSAEMRKRVRKVLGDVFNPTVSNCGGGWWKYEGRLNGSHLSASIAYASNYHQLHYEINVESLSAASKLERISFENVLGVGWGQWDFIIQENVDDSMHLLAEAIVYVSLIPARLPAGCLVTDTV